jgi:hypothetical protein
MDIRLAHTRSLMVLGTLLWTSCSSNGLDPSTNLVDLTPSQMMQLCADEAPNGTGLVKCPNGTTAMVDTPDTCLILSWSPTCTATVGDFNACADKLNADACNANLLTDLASPPCLVTQACAGTLCSALCGCSGQDAQTTCESACATFTAGLTADCATCLSGLYNTFTCPDFSALPSPYDQCSSKCPGAVALRSDGGADRG